MWQIFRPVLRSAIISCFWAVLLVVPFILYLKQDSEGVAWSLAVFVLPLVLTSLFAFVAAGQGKAEPAVDAATISRAIGVIALSTVYYDATPQPSPIAYTIFWFVSGIAFGIIWGRGKSPDDGDSSLLAGLVIAFLGALYEFRLGLKGVLSEIAILAGFALGFYVSGKFEPLAEPLRKVKEELTEKIWTFASFVVGYVIIVWVFAGLFAVDLRFDSRAISVGPGTPPPKTLGDFMFFSLSILSTSGYIDAKPASLFSKALASLELLVGISWGTVVVTRLLADAFDAKK